MNMKMNKPKFDSSGSTKGTSCRLYNAIRKSSNQLSITELQETYRNVDKGIGLAQNLQPPSSDTKYVDTRFGKMPLESPLSSNRI